MLTGSDILEQAGISWPIRNPLYLPSFLDSRTSAPHIPQSYNTSPDELFFGTGVHSPGLKQFKSPFNRPINPEPGNRPNTAPIPNAAQFPRPPLHERGRRGPPIWDDSLADSFTDSLEDVSVTDTCTWTTHTGLSKSAGDTYIPEMLETSPREVPRETLHNQRNDYDHRKRAKWLESMRGPGEEARHGVTFREDQFGRLVEAFSPPKPNRHSEQTNSHHDHGHAPSMLGPSQGYPKMGTMGAPQNTRPSAASLARTSSYSNFNNGHLRNISHNIARNPEEKKHSKDMDRSPSLAVASAKGKENRNPSENRIPTPFNLGGFTNPHHVFAQGPNPWGPSGRGTVWTTDLEARDQFASMPPQPPVARHSPAPAHVPSGRGGIKSRKEGLGVGSPASCINEQVATTRHDKSLLPAVDTQPLKEPSGDSQKHPPSHAPAPIIPIPEEDAHGRHQHPQPFIPGHRGGMSSMERVETELFSALGEELNSFSQDMGTAATHMSGDANVNVLPSLDELECSPVIKRKRRGSMGGERESPRAKVLRESEDGGCDGPENRGMHHTNENENGNGNGNGIRGTQVQLRGD